MESGGSMPNLQGLSNNPYPEPIPGIDNYLSKAHSNIFLRFTPSLHKGLFPVRVPVKIY